MDVNIYKVGLAIEEHKGIVSHLPDVDLISLKGCNVIFLAGSLKLISD